MNPHHELHDAFKAHCNASYTSDIIELMRAHHAYAADASKLEGFVALLPDANIHDGLKRRCIDAAAAHTHAPGDVEIGAIGTPGTPAREAAEALYEELGQAGLKVLLDDRDAGPGEKFADAELLGVPLRLTVGKRSLESGSAEAQARRGRVDHAGGVPLQGAAEAVRERWTCLP